MHAPGEEQQRDRCGQEMGEEHAAQLAAPRPAVPGPRGLQTGCKVGWRAGRPVPLGEALDVAVVNFARGNSFDDGE